MTSIARNKVTISKDHLIINAAAAAAATITTTTTI